MPAYEAFAGLYDVLMDDVDYDAWVEYYLALIGRMGVQPRTLCDCACGTGAISVWLAPCCKSLTVTDFSKGMLRQADKKLKSQCRVIMAALKKDLDAVGAGDVLVKNWNTWGVDTTKISCDYYDFLKRDSGAINSFRGEYMAQYSWAEMTIGNLFDINDAGTGV